MTQASVIYCCQNNSKTWTIFINEHKYMSLMSMMSFHKSGYMGRNMLKMSKIHSNHETMAQKPRLTFPSGEKTKDNGRHIC